MQVLSFDIGVKNLGYCVEKYECKCELPKSRCFLEHGVTTHLKNLCVSEEDGRKPVTKKVFLRVSCILEQLQEVLQNTNVVLLEKQLSKNTNGVKLEQHIWSWLSIKFPELLVINYSAKHKTSVFGQKFKKYSERKKWGVKYTKEILAVRKDQKNLDLLSCKKPDDMADCFLMCLSYVIREQG